MVSTSIKLITISLNSNSDLVYTKVEKARNSLAENLGEKEYSFRDIVINFILVLTIISLYSSLLIKLSVME